MQHSREKLRSTSYTRQVDGTEVDVTRHAIERYGARVRRSSTTRQIERGIQRGIFAALDESMFLPVDEEVYLAPLEMDSQRLFAVVRVEGPIEKPIAIAVCTVLSAQMAFETYSHIQGLIEFLTPRGRAIAYPAPWRHRT